MGAPQQPRTAPARRVNKARRRCHRRPNIVNKRLDRAGGLAYTSLIGEMKNNIMRELLDITNQWMTEYSDAPILS